MLNEIIKGISMALNTAFGDGYEIYQNDVEQDLKEGCFFIQGFETRTFPAVGAAFYEETLDVLYFSKGPRK